MECIKSNEIQKVNIKIYTIETFFNKLLVAQDNLIVKRRKLILQGLKMASEYAQ